MEVIFRTARVDIGPYTINSTFNDGKVNEFYIGYKDSDYKEIAKSYGYDDPVRYAQEHELAHHFIADNLGWKYSWSLHSSAGKNASNFKGEWPNHIGWEENIVNAFQHFCVDGTRDKWGVLHCVFPDKKLVEKKFEFLRLCRKVLDKFLSVSYNHETGKISEIDK